MSAPLDDIASYSAFVYALAKRHPFVTSSTLALVPIGATARQVGRAHRMQRRDSFRGLGVD
jgi:hypothetical protein